MLEDYFNAFEGEEHETFTLDGDHRAALLIHGFPGTPAEMRPIGEALHAAGFTVHAPLLPGFGAEAITIAERTQPEWANAVKSALAQLQQDHDYVIVVGLSMGGALAIEAVAEAEQKPDRLILLAPFWKVDHVVWSMMPILQVLFPQPRIFKWLRLDFSKQEVRDGIHKFMPDLDLDDPEAQQAIKDFPVPIKMFAQIHRAGKIGHQLAPQIDIPTLVIQGTQDDLVKPEATRKLIARFKGPTDYHEFNAEHVLIDTTLPDWPQIKACIVAFASENKQESQLITG